MRSLSRLRKNSANIHRDLVAFGDDGRYLVAHAGIAGVDDAPHLPHLGLAAPMAHMRHDVDRGVGDEIDIVTAAGQRALDIAGVECFEKIQHALPVEWFDQCLFSAGVAPDWHSPVHCGPNFAAINRQKIPTIGRAGMRKMVHNPGVYFRLYVRDFRGVARWRFCSFSDDGESRVVTAPAWRNACEAPHCRRRRHDRHRCAPRRARPSGLKPESSSSCSGSARRGSCRPRTD